MGREGPPKGEVELQDREERRVYCGDRPDRRILELETAKEILQEVFCTTSAEVEEMIRLRLAERDSTI